MMHVCYEKIISNATVKLDNVYCHCHYTYHWRL